MQFNTLAYLLFLTFVAAVLWRIPSERRQARKTWILVTSLAFYASWHVEYVALLLGVGVIAGAGGSYVLAAEGASRKRRGVAVIAVLVAILSIFKYADWGAENAGAVAGVFGLRWMPRPLHWLLPLGVSFYTFEGISYISECMRGKEKAHPLRDFQLFIAFFPHLVAGPIMRAKELLPQFESDKWRATNRGMVEGVWLLASGFFLKNILADWLAPKVDAGYSHAPDALSSLDTVAIAIGFGLQIYFDFSAYSRMAIGSAKICGIDLVKNFNYPFRARTPADFWNRWHISLSRWIRDYLFFPIAGKRLTVASACKGSIITMAICGLWHGAGWTYVVWGLYHGLVLAGYYLGRASLRRAGEGGLPPADHWLDAPVGVAMSSTLTWIALLPSWILFRAPTLRDAAARLRVLVTPWRHRGHALPATFYAEVTLSMLAVWAAPFVVERAQAFWKRAGEGIGGRRAAFVLGGVATGLLMFVALAFRRLGFNRAFIYFQF